MSEAEKVGFAVRAKLRLWADREDPPSMFDPIIREEMLRRFWLDRKSPLSLGLQLYQKGEREDGADVLRIRIVSGLPQV